MTLELTDTEAEAVRLAIKLALAVTANRDTYLYLPGIDRLAYRYEVAAAAVIQKLADAHRLQVEKEVSIGR
jgi:hypothetical protein